MDSARLTGRRASSDWASREEGDTADFDGDGRDEIDLVCIGGGTANLKWYKNVSP